MRASLAAVAIALAVAVSTGAAVPSGNLLVNPGAEAGAGSPDSSQIVPPPGWTVESNFTVVRTGRPTS